MGFGLPFILLLSVRRSFGLPLMEWVGRSQIVRPPTHGMGGTISLTCIYSDRALDCRKHIMCREIRQRLFTSTMVFWDAFRSEEVISFKADLDSVTCIRSLYGLPSIPGIG